MLIFGTTGYTMQPNLVSLTCMYGGFVQGGGLGSRIWFQTMQPWRGKVFMAETTLSHGSVLTVSVCLRQMLHDVLYITTRRMQQHTGPWTTARASLKHGASLNLKLSHGTPPTFFLHFFQKKMIKPIKITTDVVAQCFWINVWASSTCYKRCCNGSFCWLSSEESNICSLPLYHFSFNTYIY